MKISFEGKFKSLSSFVWEDIPSLSIITGVNGVGKTQLLELINAHFTASEKWKEDNIPNGNISLEGIEINKGELGYWKSTGVTNNFNDTFNYKQLLDISFAIFRQISPIKATELAKRSIFSIRDISNNTHIKMILDRELSNIIKSIEDNTGKKPKEFELNDIINNFPDNIFTSSGDIITRDNLSMLFYMYQFKKVIGLNDGMKEDEFTTPPWEILNEVLEVSKLPYKVDFPSFDLMQKAFNNKVEIASIPDYNVNIINPITEEVIKFNELSSGEKTIMSIALLQYYSEKRGASRKLLLLDEPDAHLHPSMTKQFFEVVYNILIKKHGAKVILTTHTPSTLALAPRENDCCVFEMKKNPTKFIKDESLNYSHTTSLLSDGLILVSPKMKLVFVEDEDDVYFYTNIFNKINESEPKSKEINSLGFISASNTKNKQTGGNKVVENWVERFDRFNNIIQGLIDLDSGNKPEGSEIYVLNRYSIENYLYDPIVLFAFLNNHKNTNFRPEIELINIPIGGDREILKLGVEKKQAIANHFFELIENEIREDIFKMQKKSRINPLNGDIEDYFQFVNVEFINGDVLKYPKWMLCHRGKNIEIIYRNKLGSNVGFSVHDLLVHLLRLNQIPSELRDLLLKIKIQ